VACVRLSLADSRILRRHGVEHYSWVYAADRWEVLHMVVMFRLSMQIRGDQDLAP
jgi:hypothetical protein